MVQIDISFLSFSIYFFLLYSKSAIRLTVLLIERNRIEMYEPFVEISVDIFILFLFPIYVHVTIMHWTTVLAST